MSEGAEDNINAEELLSRVHIAKPCPASWENMRGDERARFCDQCHKHVYNFSAMSANEAAALIRATEGRVCARFFLRRDGTVLTADCPVGVAAYRKRVKLAICQAAALVAFVAFGAAALARESESQPTLRQLRTQISFRVDNAIGGVKRWLRFLQPRPSMRPMGVVAVQTGKICLPPPPVTPPPATLPAK